MRHFTAVCFYFSRCAAHQNLAFLSEKKLFGACDPTVMSSVPQFSFWKRNGMEHATPPPPGHVSSVPFFSFGKATFQGMQPPRLCHWCHAFLLEKQLFRACDPPVMSSVPCFSFGKATFQGMRPPPPPGCVISAALLFPKTTQHFLLERSCRRVFVSDTGQHNHHWQRNSLSNE